MAIRIEDFNVQDHTVRITNWRNLRRIDPVLPIVTMALVLAGWVLLYSASRTIDVSLLHKQMLAFFVGAGIAAAIIATDYRYIVALGPLMYVGCVGVLFLTSEFGEEAKGAERWISIFGVRVQPSEFSKIVMIYFLTWYLTTVGEKIRKFRYFALTFLLTAVPVYYILKQPNLGTAATLFPLTVVLLYVAGCRYLHLALVVLAGLSVVPMVWLQIRDFDPRLRVMDADMPGLVINPDGTEEKKRDAAVSFEEFGNKFGLKYVPEAVPRVETDVVEVSSRTREVSLVLLAIKPDGTRFFRGVKKGSESWPEVMVSLKQEGYANVGMLYTPEFQGIALLDSNQNNALEPEEFTALDKNGDGKVTREDKGTFELHQHQKERIYTFLHPEFDPKDSGWQQTQSKISVGSGGLSGKGLFQGTQTRLNYLPEHHTDFIFSVLAEEKGFFGVVTVIALFVLFLLRGLWFARDTPEMMGTLLATGVVTVLAFHIFVNIAITVGLLPVTGIPLPFLSYGRSFYLTTMACVGILLNVPMRRNIFVNH